MHEMQWYAVNAKPHQEKQAELHIKQCGVECFLPLLKESKIIRRMRKTVIGPLFPGYMFARFDLTEDYRAVSYARGVRNIVEFGSKPAEVDVALIDSIKAKLNNGHVMQTPESWKHGQVVQIQDGPLGGLEAMFVQEIPGQKRAILLLRTLAFHARVVLKIDQVGVQIAVKALSYSYLAPSHPREEG